ncbi:MAG: Crp/Fnr family transcriptional regulator [Brevinemataceae bacterium]
MEPIKFKTVNFRAGTYVYVEEQSDSGEFYIVRQGKLIEENPLNSLTGEPELIIGAGDFFGVLDCMSRRPRISSIKVLEDSSLIIVRYEQFELLIKQMAPVAMKIIRYFSNRLRKYNTTITEFTSNKQGVINTGLANLINIGKYYESQGQYDLAGYAYTKYLEAYPDAFDAGDIRDKLSSLHYNSQEIAPQQSGIQEKFVSGSPIFLEHEEGSDLYIVLDGQVKITKIIENKEVLLGIIKTKDIFGEMALLEHSPRSASAIASTDVTLLRINKQNFEIHIKTHPEIARRIIELLSDRIWIVYKRLANQLISDPITKIYDALQTLLQKNRIPLQKGLHYTFEMSPTEIIQFIGLDPAEGKSVMDQILATDSALSIENGKLFSRDVYNIRSAMTISGRMNAQQVKKRTNIVSEK